MMASCFTNISLPPVVEGNIASKKECLIPLTCVHRKYTHFPLLGSKKVFCCLQNLLRSSRFWYRCSLFLSLVAMLFAAKHPSSSGSFIIRNIGYFNTYAMFSPLQLFVYFHSRSLFLSPHLPGWKRDALQC